MFANFFRKEIKVLNENNIKNVKNAIFNNDVKKAFLDFVKLNKQKDVLLIGGLSVGVYTQARNTQDIDIIVVSDSDIDSVLNDIKSKFKKNRAHSFEHKSTGVEIEILTPDFINYPKSIVRKAIENATIQDVDGHSVKIVSPKFLVALKLKRASLGNNKSYMDMFDISNITDVYGKFDLSDLELTDKELQTYERLIKDK